MIRAGSFVLAERYARALLDVALDENKKVDADKVESELAEFQAVLDKHAKLADVLASPTIAADKRVAVLEDVLEKKKLSAPVTNLLTLLTARERMSIFSLVVGQYRKLLLEHKLIQPADVTSAHPLNARQQKRLAQSLGEALGKQMELTFSNDEKLVGGLVVRVGNRVFDASVVGQLARIKEKALSSL